MAYRGEVRENCNIGIYLRLTNEYCFSACEEIAVEGYSINKQNTKLIKSTIGGLKNVGKMIVGNSKGVLISDNCTESELKNIKSQLKANMKVEIIHQQISSLSNCVVCNDSVALVHPDFDEKTIELIKNTLGVKVIKQTIGGNPLVGNYCVMSNKDVIVSPNITVEEYIDIYENTSLPVIMSTVNSGCNIINTGIAMNDSVVIVGSDTEDNEIDTITNKDD